MSNQKYHKKVSDWLNQENGNLPTYNKLINNLINAMKNSHNDLTGEHEIEFPVPAVLYDHSLDTYNPAYEYETMMFNTLLGKLESAGLDIETYTAQLGDGNDQDNWRPYVVTKVTFTEVDPDAFFEALDEYKDVVSDSILANLAKDMLETADVK